MCIRDSTPRAPLSTRKPPMLARVGASAPARRASATGGVRRPRRGGRGEARARARRPYVAPAAPAG
eukprot:3046917-Alexandrium_andersonii.AAC.1